MKFIKLIIVAIVLFSTSSHFAQNIAYVSKDSILNALPTYSEKYKTLDSLSAAYKTTIDLDKKQLSTKAEALLQPYSIKENETIEDVKKRMSEIDLSKWSIIEDEEKLIAKKVKNYELLLKNNYDTTIQPLLNKVNTAIEKYATANKIDAVYIIETLTPALAYINKKKNITQIIIKSIK